MRTAAPEPAPGFAVWLTGLPASGKSTLARALKAVLAARGIDCAVLESDVLRAVLTPQPCFDEQERDTFYNQMAFIGALLTQHGVAVIFDATANRREHRDGARRRIAKFLEVWVNSPLEICMARDPKGIYGKGVTVPGLQVAYEPPMSPDVVIQGDREDSGEAAQRIVAVLVQRGYVPA